MTVGEVFVGVAAYDDFFVAFGVGVVFVAFVVDFVAVALVFVAVGDDFAGTVTATAVTVFADAET